MSHVLVGRPRGSWLRHTPYLVTILMLNVLSFSFFEHRKHKNFHVHIHWHLVLPLYVCNLQLQQGSFLYFQVHSVKSCKEKKNTFHAMLYYQEMFTIQNSPQERSPFLIHQLISGKDIDIDWRQIFFDIDGPPPPLHLFEPQLHTSKILLPCFLT